MYSHLFSCKTGMWQLAFLVNSCHYKNRLWVVYIRLFIFDSQSMARSGQNFVCWMKQYNFNIKSWQLRWVFYHKSSIDESLKGKQSQPNFHIFRYKIYNTKFKANVYEYTWNKLSNWQNNRHNNAVELYSVDKYIT